MKNQNTNTENRIIVAFHTGRGGRFNNAGHITYIGEKNLQDLISLNDSNLFEKNRTKNGRFCKSHFVDHNGTVIVDADDMTSLVGQLNFDYQYDTDSACYIEDCSDEELEVIANSIEFKSDDLISYLESVTEYKFDTFGVKIEEN